MGEVGPTKARGENIDSSFVAASRGMLLPIVSARIAPLLLLPDYQAVAEA
jgi:hypothetical protein